MRDYDEDIESVIQSFLFEMYAAERVRVWERVVTNYIVLTRIRAYWGAMGHFLQWVRQRGKLALQ